MCPPNTSGEIKLAIPLGDLRQILADFVDVLFMFEQLVLELWLQLTPCRRSVAAVDGVHHEVKAIEIVQHYHIERRNDGSSSL